MARLRHNSASYHARVSPMMLKTLKARSISCFFWSISKIGLTNVRVDLSVLEKHVEYCKGKCKNVKLWRKEEIAETHGKLGELSAKVLGLHKTKEKNRIVLWNASQTFDLSCDVCNRSVRVIKKKNGKYRCRKVKYCKCYMAKYCSKKHQKIGWKSGHSKLCWH